MTAFKSQPPPHPSRRRQPLPHCTPKPASEDPEAPARIQAILASPAYRIASEDLGFLAGPSARGLRLMMDYQKPEDLLQAEGVKRTIVVFGSTRIGEPAAARAASRPRAPTSQQARPTERRRGGWRSPSARWKKPLLRDRARLRPARRPSGAWATASRSA